MGSKLLQSFQLDIPSSRWKHLISRAVQALKDPRIIHASLVYRLARTKFRFWIYPAYWRYLGNTALSYLRQQSPTSIEVSQVSHSDSRRYITVIPNQWSGIGHQLSNWSTALIFSQQYNLQFIHHPLSKGWDDFLGFGEGEIQYIDLIVPFTGVVKDKSLKLVNLPRTNANNDISNDCIRKEDSEGDRVLDGIINFVYPGNNIIFHLQEEQSVYDQTSSTNLLRKKYWERRKSYSVRNDFDSTKINVAVHIRRGDIVKWKQEKTANWQARWLDESYFIKVVKKVYELLHDQQLVVHLYSQGSVKDFEEFNQFPELIFHVDEDEFQTFHGMVVADILVTSPSGFSYMAGLLSEGIKITRYPFSHFIPENEEWIRSDEKGEFRTASLMRKYMSIHDT